MDALPVAAAAAVRTAATTVVEADFAAEALKEVTGVMAASVVARVVAWTATHAQR